MPGKVDPRKRLSLGTVRIRSLGSPWIASMFDD